MGGWATASSVDSPQALTPVAAPGLVAHASVAVAGGTSIVTDSELAPGRPYASWYRLEAR